MKKKTKAPFIHGFVPSVLFVWGIGFLLIGLVKINIFQIVLGAVFIYLSYFRHKKHCKVKHNMDISSPI